MYFVKYGEEYLHDPRGDDELLLSVEISVEPSTCGCLTFSVADDHPMRSLLRERDPENPVEVWDGETLIFAGYIWELGHSFELTGEVSCKGELAYLGDSVVRPYSTVAGAAENDAPSTVDGYFRWLIDQHNAHVGPSQQFAVGVNQAAALDKNNHILRSSDQLPTTAEELQEKLLDALGGYVFARREDGRRVIDYLSDCVDVNAQVIDFGVNLLDYVRTDNCEELYTAIRPTGGTPEGEDEKPVTLAGIPDGPYPRDPAYVKQGDRVYHAAAARRYGMIEMAWDSSDALDPGNLLDAAVVKLRGVVEPKTTLEIKAIDAAIYMQGYSPLRAGQLVRVRSKPHGFDGYLMVGKIDLDLSDPTQTVYTLGSTYDSLTGETDKQIRRLNASINGAYDAVAPLPRAVKDAASKADGAAQDAADATAKADGALTAAGQAAEQAQSAEGKAQEAIDKLADLHGTYVHVKWSDSPDGSGMGDAPGAYMGICSNESPDAPADPAAYAWAKVRGEDGQRGEDGEDGTPSYVHIKWADDAHGAGMRETPGPYMGTCVDSVEADPTDPGRYAWALVKGADGQQGDPGKPGDKGDPGRGIASTSVSYQAGTSGTAAPAGAWTPTVPVVPPDRYLWTRTVTAYTSGPSTTAYSVGKIGAQGDKGDPGGKGDKGDKGDTGGKGADGKTLYGACNTAAATAAKVPASAIAGFSLYSGSCVSIKFTYANSAAAPTLNVNGTGAKPIKLNGANSAYWQAGATVALVYDGAAWQVCNTPLYGATSIIGNPAGGNVHTDGDGVSVRQGTTVLARLKAGLLELAANSADAVIKLCGGKGTIAYYPVGDQLAIMSPGAIAITTSYMDDAGHVMPSDAGIACNKTGVLAKGRVEVSGSLAVNSGGVYGETLLFSDPAHPLNASAPLSQPAARFRRLKIGFRTNDGHVGYAETAGDKPDGQVVDLTCNVTNGMNMYIKSKSVLVRGSTISTYFAGGKYWTGEWGSDTGYVFADVVGIIQVVGVR